MRVKVALPVTLGVMLATSIVALAAIHWDASASARDALLSGEPATVEASPDGEQRGFDGRLYPNPESGCFDLHPPEGEDLAEPWLRPRPPGPPDAGDPWSDPAQRGPWPRCELPETSVDLRDDPP